MKTYTAVVTWLIPTWRDYKKKSKTIHKIEAETITEASDKALETIKDQICPAVSCIWYDYPQPVK